MSTSIPASKHMRHERRRMPTIATGRRFTKNTLLGRPDRRKDSGTVDTAFRGRRRAKRIRLRKLQRLARRTSLATRH